MTCRLLSAILAAGLSGAAEGASALPDERTLLELSQRLFGDDVFDEGNDEREFHLERDDRAKQAASESFALSDFGEEMDEEAAKNFNEKYRLATQEGLGETFRKCERPSPPIDESALRGPKGRLDTVQNRRQRLQRSEPLMWLHVPKCGSSFSNALVHLPGVCPGIPRNLEISERTYGPFHLRDSIIQWDFLGPNCRGNIGKWGEHAGVENEREFERRWKGKGLTVLRDPEARVVSAWNDKQHSWPRGDRLAKSLHEYATGMRGCVTRMLTQGGTSGGSMAGHWGGPCGGNLVPPQQKTVDLALARIRNFTFVGLQEYWPLSMCLLHAKLGGPCYPQEFLNSRHMHDRKPRLNRQSQVASRGEQDQEAEEVAEHMPGEVYSHNTVADLQGITDPYDRQIYDAMEASFAEELKQYNVNERTCAPCWAQATGIYTSAGAATR